MINYGTLSGQKPREVQVTIYHLYGPCGLHYGEEDKPSFQTKLWLVLVLKRLPSLSHFSHEFSSEYK